jgi:SAM-dependent methyltransferase
METLTTPSQQAKALEFDEIAERIFAPIYPVLSAQIIAATGIKRGSCLDIGCGGGHLGLNLALLSPLKLTLVDCSAPAVALAKARSEKWGIAGQTLCLPGDVHDLPLADGSQDLCVSRGSLWFWQNSEKAFSEILRVLRPGGQAYLGSGFATAELKERIDVQMRDRDATWPARHRKFTAGHTPERYAELLTSLPQVADWRIIDDERGFWLHFSKRGQS